MGSLTKQCSYNPGDALSLGCIGVPGAVSTVKVFFISIFICFALNSFISNDRKINKTSSKKKIYVFINNFTSENLLLRNRSLQQEF